MPRVTRSSLAGLLLAVVLASCASGTGAPQSSATVLSSATPTALATPTVDPTWAAIQATLDGYALVNREGTEPIAALVDPNIPALRRILGDQQRFLDDPHSPTGTTYTVQEVVYHTPSLALVTIARPDGLITQRWFRSDGSGAWLFSEPYQEELGEPQTESIGPLTVVTYPWLEERGIDLKARFRQALDTIEATLGPLPDEPVRVTLKPAAHLPPTLDSFTTGLYTPGEPDQLVLSLPGSAVYPYIDPALDPYEHLSRVLIHELAHWATHRGHIDHTKIPLWLLEGIAEYVAQPRPSPQVIASTTWLPMEAPDQRDLLHMDRLPPGDRRTAYVQAHLLVVYLVERAGLNSIWVLAETYSATPGIGAARLDSAVEQVYAVSLEQLLNDWSAWLAEQE